MVVGILIFFAFVFILVKAFAKEKPDKIITKDKDGNENVQYVEKGKSAGKTSAQIVLWIIFIPIFVLIIFVLIL